jgi:hypothetical protein
MVSISEPMAILATNPELRAALEQTYERYLISQSSKYNYSFQEFVERRWNNRLPFCGPATDLLWIWESPLVHDFMEPNIKAQVDYKTWNY